MEYNDRDVLNEIEEIKDACKDLEGNIIDFDFSKVYDHITRRVQLSTLMNKYKLICPSCGTRQVQLVGYMDIYPAQWRCRHCKHEFEWEGE